MGTEEMWPYLLASSGVPAILQFVTLLFFPETPRYLYIDKGDTEGSKKGEWIQQTLIHSTLDYNVYKDIFASLDKKLPHCELSFHPLLISSHGQILRQWAPWHIHAKGPTIVHTFILLNCIVIQVVYVCICKSLAVAVAGGKLKAGAGRHAEREREHTGREGEDCEGCPLLSLCEVAAVDSAHPLCWCSVLWHQRCTFISAFLFITQ